MILQGFYPMGSFRRFDPFPELEMWIGVSGAATFRWERSMCLTCRWVVSSHCLTLADIRMNPKVDFSTQLRWFIVLHPSDDRLFHGSQQLSHHSFSPMYLFLLPSQVHNVKQSLPFLVKTRKFFFPSFLVSSSALSSRLSVSFFVTWLDDTQDIFIIIVKLEETWKLSWIRLDTIESIE